jgi:hypothetical protein
VSSLNHYLFQSIWVIHATPADVYAVLHDVGSYSMWWPEIKRVERVNEDRFSLRVRSVLPYYLDFESTRVREDKPSGVLEARLSGDLDGYSRWTIEASGGVTRAVFDEEVDTHKRSLNLLAPLARPAFKANHTFMMRHGQAGLRTFVAGIKFGEEAQSR